MQLAFRAQTEAESSEFVAFSAITRVTRVFIDTLPERSARDRCQIQPKSRCIRPLLTAEVNASVQTVAHRNGKPPGRGTQSQGLRTRRSPGYRIGPPMGFLSRPEPIRKEVCHAESKHART
jgi:hypothetical protein